MEEEKKLNYYIQGKDISFIKGLLTEFEVTAGHLKVS